MGYTYTPTYYSGLQDTITSFCKSIFRPGAGRRLTADQAAARRHAEAIKWQQESFHRILHLSALHREGMVQVSEVEDFRASMLATLAASASPHHPDQPAILRDKLLFLQELLHNKCISAAEYNSTKRPLVQRLAALGIVTECPDVDAAGSAMAAPAPSSAEEWSEIDLQDPRPSTAASDKHKHKAFIPPWKSSRGKKEQDANLQSRPPLAQVDLNHAKNASVLMVETPPSEATPSLKVEKGKRRHLTAMFHNGGENKEPPAVEETTEEKGTVKSKKKSSWGFDGLKKWKKAGGGGNEEAMVGSERYEGAPPPRSSYSDCRLEASPAAASPDAKRAKKKKLHQATGVDVSASDLVNDKVLVEETKKELSRIQAELSSTNRNLNFSDQQIEAISTRLPVDKSDLKTFFPKAWCEQHGDSVINAAQKEFKDHVEEMEKEKQREEDITTGDSDWAASFRDDSHEDDEFNPRASSFQQHQSGGAKVKKVEESLGGSEHFTNPFYDEKNPFWNHQSNMTRSFSTCFRESKTTMICWFCRAWCEQHGDSVINAAQKEFKDHAKVKKVEESLGGSEHFTNPFYDEKNPFWNHQSYN